jgi:hypothetical protein
LLARLKRTIVLGRISIWSIAPIRPIHHKIFRPIDLIIARSIRFKKHA